MKNICSRVKVSWFLILIIFLSFISGLFKDVLVLFLIIIVHEIGHVITSLMFGWKIKKIDITICGGFITYDEEIDKPFIEEFLISISGFLFQGILYFILSVLMKNAVIDDKLYFLFEKYNLSIFLFNIILIYPLDGSKVSLILFNVFLPYKKSLKLISITSFITLIFTIIYVLLHGIKLEYSYIMIISFIISKLINLVKDIPYLFNRLLFERYKKPIITNKRNYIKNGLLLNFKRQKKNYFLINNKYYDESYILKEKFDLKNNMW